MNKIVKKSSCYENWNKYINYEKHFCDIKSIRKVFKRAVEYSKDQKFKLAVDWIEWERK